MGYHKLSCAVSNHITVEDLVPLLEYVFVVSDLWYAAPDMMVYNHVIGLK